MKPYVIHTVLLTMRPDRGIAVLHPDGATDAVGDDGGAAVRSGPAPPIGPGNSTLAGGVTGALARVSVPKSTFAAVSNPSSA
jgi:hypothetical protein